MKSTNLFAAVLACAATAAFAHQNVSNPAVKARMDGMTAIASNMKILGSFAKQVTPFDAAQARAAARAIADHAAETPDLFRMNEDDPKSEALPSIWQNFDDFTAKSVKLETLATRFSGSVSTLEDLGPAMAALGGACKSCHSDYRE